MNQRLNTFGRLVALLALGGAGLVAQGVQTGTVVGTIRSTGGRPIQGASVTLKTGQGDRSTLTDAAGAFRFGLLTPGNARLVVSAKDHVGASAEVRIGVDKANITDFSLRPITEAATTVMVIASTENIDSTDAKSGKNFALDSINSMPVNNRNITAIASLSPGTSNDANGLTIRGAQSTQVQYLVDGADVMDPVTGGPAVRLNEELLEEVQVQTGAISAEYGRFTGGVVNTVTKSGTNDFRGVMRFDLTNTNWNAYNPLDRGRDGLNKFKNAHSVIQSYVFSGPILKDRLFFLVGYRTTSPQTSTPGTTSSADFGGVPYATTRTEDRKDIKVDWQINADHKVFWQWNKTLTQRTNIDYPAFFGYGSTSLATLSAQADLFQYITFGYQGQLSNTMYLDVRLNHKKETLGSSAGQSGGQGPKNVVSWIDLYTFDVFDNGFFANDGDSRPIRTANASLTWFVDGAGQHEIKAGIQLFESQRNSANAQTPSNYFIYFLGFDTPGSSAVSNRVLVPNDRNSTFLEWWEPVNGATTKNRVDGIYVNDKWKLDKHWSFNLGLRYDRFISKDDLGRENFSFTDLSPRLAAIWDIGGNNRSVLSANYGIYVGQIIQGATDASSPAGNPIWRQYEYIGGPAVNADGSLNRSAFAANPFFVDDPFLQRLTTIDPGVKSPRMTEISFEYRHNDGAGTTWSANLVRRKWDRFVDDFKQNDPDTGNTYTTIKNDPSVNRDYIGLELQYQRRMTESFSYGVNATISSLRGNYEGGQVGTTEQRNNFGANGIPVNFLGPNGFLAADRPLTIIGNANYRLTLGKGAMNLGTLVYFNSGAPYSLTGGSTPSNLDGYNSTYTKFFGDRGSQRFPSTHQVDIQVGYDIPLWKMVNFFARLNVTNVFNHQILQSWNTTGTTSPTTGNWVAGSSYGRPTSAGNYITARTINLAGGFRF